MKSKNLHVRDLPSRLSHLRSWAPALGWAAILFIASSIPGTAYPKVGWPLADKAVHLGLYGFLGGLVAIGARSSWPDLSTAQRVIRCVLITAAYGLSDELHQLFVPFRSFDLWDLLADTIGAAIGAAIVTRFLEGPRQR